MRHKEEACLSVAGVQECGLSRGGRRGWGRTKMRDQSLPRTRSGVRHDGRSVQGSAWRKMGWIFQGFGL